MIAQHYIQLFLHYRRLFVPIILGFGLGAALFSTIMLVLAPNYVAIATINIIPGQSELERLPGGQSRSSDVFIRGHTERLLSRETAMRALGILGSAAHPQPTADEPASGGAVAWVSDLVRSARRDLKRWYHLMNSGQYNAVDPTEAAIAGLLDSVQLRVGDFSDIVRIVATDNDARGAADIANAFAEAYRTSLVERAEKRFYERKARLLDDIASRDAALDTLLDRETRLRAQLGNWSPDEQRDALLESRQDERERLLQVRVEKKQLEAQLETFTGNEASLRQRGVLGSLQQEIALLGARIHGLGQSEQMRMEAIDAIDAKLATLAERRKPFDVLERERSQVLAELADLHTRLVSVEIEPVSDLSQVQIITPAKAPNYPSSPKVVRNTVLGLIAGALVALFLLIALDTLSDVVRTTTDLRRAVGDQVLGWLPGRLLSRLARTGPHLGHSGRRILGARAAAIEPRLAAAGGLQSSVVHVTGFGDAEFIDGATLAVAMLLGNRGLVVLCSRARTDQRYLVTRKAGQLSVRDVPESTDAPVAEACLVNDLGPLGAQFKWPATSGQAPILICIVPAGSLHEETLEQFQANALNHEYARVHYLLIAR